MGSYKINRNTPKFGASLSIKQFPWNLAKMIRLKRRKWLKVKFSTRFSTLKKKNNVINFRFFRTYKNKIKKLFKIYFAPKLTDRQCQKLLRLNSRYKATFQKLLNIETRVDTLIYRLYMVSNIALARELIKKNYFLINNKVITSPTMNLNVGDILSPSNIFAWQFLYQNMLKTVSSLLKYFNRLFFKFSFPFIIKRKNFHLKEYGKFKKRTLKFLNPAIISRLTTRNLFLRYKKIKATTTSKIKPAKKYYFTHSLGNKDFKLKRLKSYFLKKTKTNFTLTLQRAVVPKRLEKNFTIQRNILKRGKNLQRQLDFFKKLTFKAKQFNDRIRSLMLGIKPLSRRALGNTKPQIKKKKKKKFIKKLLFAPSSSKKKKQRKLFRRRLKKKKQKITKAIRKLPPTTKQPAFMKSAFSPLAFPTGLCLHRRLVRTSFKLSGNEEVSPLSRFARRANMLRKENVRVSHKIASHFRRLTFLKAATGNVRSKKRHAVAKKVQGLLKVGAKFKKFLLSPKQKRKLAVSNITPVARKGYLRPARLKRSLKLLGMTHRPKRPADLVTIHRRFRLSRGNEELKLNKKRTHFKRLFTPPVALPTGPESSEWSSSLKGRRPKKPTWRRWVPKKAKNFWQLNRLTKKNLYLFRYLKKFNNKYKQYSYFQKLKQIAWARNEREKPFWQKTSLLLEKKKRKCLTSHLAKSIVFEKNNIKSLFIYKNYILPTTNPMLGSIFEPTRQWFVKYPKNKQLVLRVKRKFLRLKGFFRQYKNFKVNVQFSEQNPVYSPILIQYKKINLLFKNRPIAYYFVEANYNDLEFTIVADVDFLFFPYKFYCNQ